MRWPDSSFCNFALTLYTMPVCAYTEWWEFSITVPYWRCNGLFTKTWQYTYLNARFSQNESEILHISFVEHPLPVIHEHAYAPLQWIGMGTYIFHKQCISMSRNVEAIWWTMWRMFTRPCICFIANTISSILLL